MDTIEWFSESLAKLGAPNFLVIGIAIIVIYLIISGFRKGMRKGDPHKGPSENDQHEPDE